MLITMNSNIMEELRNLGFMKFSNDFKTEKKFVDIDSCNKFCHKYCRNESKMTFSNESVYELSISGREESSNKLTTKLIDNNIMAENFIFDFKFKSQDEMENQERLTCETIFNNEIDSNQICNDSEDSETLILYYDESDIDGYMSDNETVKHIEGTESDCSDFEKRLENREICAVQQNCTNSNTWESNAKIPCEYDGSKTGGFYICNMEDDFKKSNKDQQSANIRNENLPQDINSKKINDFKSSMIEQDYITEHEDPDILKIFYDESDIDSDYNSDSEISGKSKEVKVTKPEIKEKSQIPVNKEACDHDLTVSNDAVSSYINLLNYISKDNSKGQSQMNSSHTPEAIQSAENTLPDYYEEEKEDLMNPGWDKIKSLSTDNERCNEVAKCWQLPSVSDPNKNLTYYSFRKRVLCSEEDTNQRMPVKRRASDSLNDQDAKRTRLCTYIADDRIKTIEDERNEKIKQLRKEFDLKMKKHFMNHRFQENRWKQQHLSLYGTLRNFEKIKGPKLKSTRKQFKRHTKFLKDKFERKFKILKKYYTGKINSSYKKRREILEFCNFYKITKTDSGGVPTVLTSDQQLIFNEIENIYKQLDIFYCS